MRPLKPPSDKRSITKLRDRARKLERRGPGPWHYVGEAGEPPFVNGANAAASSAIPDPVPLRFRITLGAGLELQGDVTEVSPGDLVFTLPVGYRLDHDVPVDGHDDLGNYVACRLFASGDFVYGVT